MSDGVQLQPPDVNAAKDLINKAFSRLNNGIDIAVDGISVVISFGLTMVGLFRDKLDAWARANILDPAVNYLRQAKDTLERALPLIDADVNNIQQVLGYWSAVAQNQIVNLWNALITNVWPRISTLEKWREDAAAWLHNYLQPIAEGAQALANTLKEWVNNVAVPWFNSLESKIAEVKASLNTAYKNLVDSINDVRVKIDNTATAIRSEISTAVANIQNTISQAVATLTGQIKAVDDKNTAAWTQLNQALQTAQATLSQAITQTQTEMRNNIAEVTGVMTEEMDKERKEGVDWILELFCLVTHSVTIEGQSRLAEVLTKAFTGMKR
jgi:phage-related protein